MRNTVKAGTTYVIWSRNVPGHFASQVGCLSHLANCRNHDPTPEPFVTSHIATAGGEQTYIYPRKDQNPTAVYDGLRALLPHVSGPVRLASSFAKCRGQRWAKLRDRT